METDCFVLLYLLSLSGGDSLETLRKKDRKGLRLAAQSHGARQTGTRRGNPCMDGYMEEWVQYMIYELWALK